MRRSEKEVFDTGVTRDFLENNKIVRVAFNTGEAPYIVPLSYGFDYDDEKLTLYLHGALEGRKIELAKKAPNVGFEIDDVSGIISDEAACKFSINYRSIIGTGQLHIIEDITEKRYCLNRIMHQFTGKEQWEYSEEMLKKTATLKLSVNAFAMKKD